MADENAKLIDRLRKAGFSRAAIEAAWPSWWTEDADKSPSGRAELRFALARRLGLDPRPLLGERVEFIWNDEAKFKHLSAASEHQKSALTSFGVSIGRLLLRATPRSCIRNVSADKLRDSILSSNAFVDLESLISACWALGIPVIYLRVFPMEAKSMHAMVVSVDDRFAILLGRDAQYPAPVAFTLAHELGHVMLDHLKGAPALVDVEDPASTSSDDDQEKEADQFALTLLTGGADREIKTNLKEFNAPTLANAVMRAAAQYRIEPGTMALCVGYQTGLWAVATSALNFIYSRSIPAWPEVNGIANSELEWDELSIDSQCYLRKIMAISDV